MESELVSEEVILTTDEGEQAVFAAWAARVGGIDVDGLANSGCGCCVDIYTVRASAEQVAELNALLYPTQS